MSGEQLWLFSRDLDLRHLPVRVRASYGRFQAMFYRHRLVEGRFRYGRLEGARRWSDPRWWQEFDCSRRSIEAWVRHGLVRWEGDDLVVEHYDCTADAKADLFSRLQRDRVSKRWHPPDRVQGSNPAQRFNSAHTERIPARARVRPRVETSPLEGGSDLGSPESIDLPPPSSLWGAGEEGGGGLESLVAEPLPEGAQAVWDAYPDVKRDGRWLKSFHRWWRTLHLERHTQEVLEQLERFKRSRKWSDDYFISLPHNFLENYASQVRRRWQADCPCGYCRTNPAPKVALVAREETKASKPPTEEELAEMRAQAMKRPWREVQT